MATLPDLIMELDTRDTELKSSTSLRHTIAILLLDLARWVLGREFELVIHMSFEDGKDEHKSE